ncbi:MAG: PhzF family phenazine biosynthesis protein [Solirubrobacterales bacterium]
MKYYVVDAFAEKVFQGNPAGVCVLEEKLGSDAMQKIAAENNLSETAFVYKRSQGQYDLKWFTPKSEINLCGHATLGTAYVITHFVDLNIKEMSFNTLSGVLGVNYQDGLYTLNFPSIMPKKIEIIKEIEDAIGAKPLEVYLDRDLMVLLKDEETIAALKPDFGKIGALKDGLGLIVTAKGSTSDFVSRCFYPKMGVNEDPVTGSAHSNLIPYWSEKLNKNKMKAIQLSERKGVLHCELSGDRVHISGTGVLYMTGEINI